MRLVFRVASVALLLLVPMTSRLLAQSPTGAIHGVVMDQQGAVIPDALVTVRNKATGDQRTTLTGGEGVYWLDSLSPGVYNVKVEAVGFTTQLQPLTVQVGRTTPGDFTLRVGLPSEIIEAVSGGPLLDRTNHTIDGVITHQKLNVLPLNGRNFLQLALLEPGVSVAVSNLGGANNLFSVSVGGAETQLTRITVDGGSVVDPVSGSAAQNFSVETIQEFQISSFNFDLSTGITSAGAINIISRAGTNQLHGNLFAFYRNHHLAAAATLGRNRLHPDPSFNRAQFGGAVGGPIKKDRAFFFGNVEWLNQDDAIVIVHTGFPGFSQFDTIHTRPYDGLVVNGRGDVRINGKNNLFVRASHDDNQAFAPNVLNTLPSNWRVNRNHDTNAQIGLTTVMTPNLVNDLRFNYQRIENESLIPSASDCPPSDPGCLGLGGALLTVVGSNITLGNNAYAPQSRHIHRYQFTDHVSWLKRAHTIRLGGEWDHDTGHGIFDFFDPAGIVLHDPRTVLAVNAQIAAQPLPPDVKQALTIPLPAAFTTAGATVTIDDILQLPLAVAFVGLGDPSQPPPFNAHQARRNHRIRVYGQDAWLVRPGFTFTYGVAYQLETNLINHDLPKTALIRPLIGSLDKPGRDTNNVAPALGLAWDVGNTGRTVIRGGAGLYYDTILRAVRLIERSALGPLGNGRSQLTGAFFQNAAMFPQIPGLPPPLNQINPTLGAPAHFPTLPTKFTGRHFLNLLNTQLPQIQARLAALGNAGLTGLDFFKTGTDILDSQIQVPYAGHASIGLQRQLPAGMVISADFVLRQRRHLLFRNDLNLFQRAAARGGPVIPKCAGAQAADPQARCSNGPINIIQSSGRDRYTALLVKLDGQWSNRYQFTASYALSQLTGFFTGEDVTDWFGHHGLLNTDARHRLTVSGVIDWPWDFQTSLIAVAASRSPFNARIPGTLDLNGDGTLGDTLPGLAINSLGRGTGREELRRLIAQFNQQFAGKRDAHGTTIPPLVLPSRFDFNDTFQSLDVRLTKTFKFRERYSVQVLVEVFNLFNIANLGGFSPNLDAGRLDATGAIIPPATFNFGQPTIRVGQSFGTGGPRAFQLGARFNF